jgi:hypothetical protein
MTRLTNNFDGGADGVAISVANSGGASGTPFTAMFGTGMLYEADAAFQGGMGARTAAGSIGAAQIGVSTTQLAGKMYFKVSAIPTSNDMYLARVHAGATRLFSVHSNAAGKLRVSDASGTTGVFTATNALAPDTWYRLEFAVVAGASNTTGSIKFAYYLGNGTTPEGTYTTAAANVGTAQTFTNLYMGKYSTSAETFDFDAFTWDDATSDLIGLSAGTPPNVSTPAVQNVGAGAVATISVTASSSGSSIASYAWSFTYSSAGGAFPTLTGATTSSASFTTSGTPGQLYLLQCVVTDADGLTTTVAAEVRVPTTGDAAPLIGASSAAVGTWSNVGSASTAGHALSDALDTTYLESPSLSASAVSSRYRLQPMTSRSALTVNVRLSQDTAGSTTIKVRLYEGNTMRQEWTQAITTSFVDYPFTVTTPANITDWGNLYLEFVGTAP